MRGEKLRKGSEAVGLKGSPPLARGKVVVIVKGGNTPGITPACAGKSCLSYAAESAVKDHPRLRGEKHGKTLHRLPVRGSPPLARGKGAFTRSWARLPGITPACAGKSQRYRRRRSAEGDHPRLRGEKKLDSELVSDSLGSPPLARGKDVLRELVQAGLRITPACAGKRTGWPGHRKRTGDHPRLRGEKFPSTRRILKLSGSPPLARGKE